MNDVVEKFVDIVSAFREGGKDISFGPVPYVVKCAIVPTYVCR